MFSRKRIRFILTLCVLIIFTFGTVPDCYSEGVEETLPEVQEKMAKVSEEEKQIVQNLFLLTHEIEGMERDEARLGGEIDGINLEIKALEETIKEETAAYEKKQEDMKKVLQSYQRSGPGSYLEIILNSDNLDSFLKRLNIVRDLTKNTGKLLDTLEESHEKLMSEKAGLADKLALTEEKQRQLTQAMDSKVRLKGELERYQASLSGEMDHYKVYLAEIEKEWNSLEDLFSEAEKEFAGYVDKGYLPLDSFKIEFSLFNIKGSIDERAFNSIVEENSSLPDIQFSFLPDKLQISVPEKNLLLKGNLVIEDKYALRFEAEEGSFHGMPLEKEALEELFLERPLVINLKPMLAGGSISSVKIAEGRIELTILPNWGY